MADVLLVYEVNTACVALLQGVNEKPFCCQPYIITLPGSYLKVGICGSLGERVCVCVFFVSVSVCVSMAVSGKLVCVCVCAYKTV